MKDDGTTWQDNPFDQLGLDPRSTPSQLTQILRQRAEHALPEERAKLQGLWQKLTLKERDRIRWALLAHPRQQDTPGSGQSIESLRHAIPPYIVRGKPPALSTEIADALCQPTHESTGEQESTLRPPSFFASLLEGASQGSQ